MAKKLTKQEILLLTGSSFARRDFCETRPGQMPANLSPVESLEAACWNGLLDQFIDEAPVNKRNGDKLFLWKIHVADAFLCVELSQSPGSIDPYYSLDPYLYLPGWNFN